MKQYIKPSISIDNLYSAKPIANDFFFTEGEDGLHDNETYISTGGWWDLFSDEN